MQLTLVHSSELDDNELKNTWNDIGSKQKTVFPEGDVASATDFIELARAEGTILFVAYVDGIRANVTWLNSFDGYAARIHFCFFRRFYRVCVPVGREIIKCIFELEREDGSPGVKTLIGLVPLPNTLAIRYAENVGLKTIAQIPDACIYDDKSVPGVLSYIHHTSV